MARMEVNYILNVENKAGVEDNKKIKMYIPFSFSDSPEKVYGSVVDAMHNNVKRMDCELLSGIIFAYFEGLEVFKAEFYNDKDIGGNSWLSSPSETMH